MRELGEGTLRRVDRGDACYRSWRKAVTPEHRPGGGQLRVAVTGPGGWRLVMATFGAGGTPRGSSIQPNEQTNQGRAGTYLKWASRGSNVSWEKSTHSRKPSGSRVLLRPTPTR
jgi:hypothetical protein